MHAARWLRHQSARSDPAAPLPREREKVMDDQKEQDRIRRRAYEIWEREGSPEGRAEEFWEQATASISADDAKAATPSDAAADEPERQESTSK